mgnify:CR=1 FL=1
MNCCRARPAKPRESGRVGSTRSHLEPDLEDSIEGLRTRPPRDDSATKFDPRVVRFFKPCGFRAASGGAGQRNFVLVEGRARAFTIHVPQVNAACREITDIALPGNISDGRRGKNEIESKGSASDHAPWWKLQLNENLTEAQLEAQERMMRRTMAKARADEEQHRRTIEAESGAMEDEWERRRRREFAKQTLIEEQHRRAWLVDVWEEEQEKERHRRHEAAVQACLAEEVRRTEVRLTLREFELQRIPETAAIRRLADEAHQRSAPSPSWLRRVSPTERRRSVLTPREPQEALGPAAAGAVPRGSARARAVHPLHGGPGGRGSCSRWVCGVARCGASALGGGPGCARPLHARLPGPEEPPAARERPRRPRQRAPLTLHHPPAGARTPRCAARAPDAGAEPARRGPTRRAARGAPRRARRGGRGRGVNRASPRVAGGVGGGRGGRGRCAGVDGRRGAVAPRHAGPPESAARGLPADAARRRGECCMRRVAEFRYAVGLFL